MGYWGHSEQALRELEVPRNLHPSLTPQPLAKDSWVWELESPCSLVSSFKLLGGIRGTIHIRSSPGAQADTPLNWALQPNLDLRFLVLLPDPLTGVPWEHLFKKLLQTILSSGPLYEIHARHTLLFSGSSD